MIAQALLSVVCCAVYTLVLLSFLGLVSDEDDPTFTDSNLRRRLAENKLEGESKLNAVSTFLVRFCCNKLLGPELFSLPVGRINSKFTVFLETRGELPPASAFAGVTVVPHRLYDHDTAFFGWGTDYHSSYVQFLFYLYGYLRFSWINWLRGNHLNVWEF